MPYYMKKNKKDLLEEEATKLTGIRPIKDYEYQRLEYSRISKGKTRQKRKELFKTTRRVI